MSDQGTEIEYGGEAINLYKLQRESPVSLDEVRAKYDGTFFHGINAVQAVFDNKGEVREVLSFNLLSQNSPPTRYKESSHETFSIWHPENLPDRVHAASLVSTRDEGKKLMAIIESAKREWKEWKATENEHPGVDFRTWKASRVQGEIPVASK